eukprot:scaffold1259_cov368-Prasinococcus_capsulatus_cf.AAC.2
MRIPYSPLPARATAVRACTRPDPWRSCVCVPGCEEIQAEGDVLYKGGIERVQVQLVLLRAVPIQTWPREGPRFVSRKVTLSARAGRRRTLDR